MVYKRAQEREQTQRLSLVWHAAALNAQAQVGKLPKLRDLLRDAKGTAQQTRTDHASAFAQVAANLGLPVKQARLIRKA